ncbi:MAG: hypothetical protein DKINENOH_00496 [bacterium]|nr:hypothetical protein [bacterium]
MQRFYADIIDECIEKFRLEEGLSFNFSLLDFRDEVFHNYGLKPPLPEHELRQLLSHAQKYVNEQRQQNPAFTKLKRYLWDDLRNAPEEEVRALFEIVLDNKPVCSVPHLTSNHLARLVSFLPTKHYWDICGQLYRRACEDESSFSKIYLNHYRYDEAHRRPEEVLCREIDIPSNAIDFYRLRDRFAVLHQKPFKRNDEYFDLQPGDRDLYELYGQLYDLLNWGTSNPAPVISYLDARTQVFEFYNCVFPIVFHGIYYGIAYFALPADYFHRTRNVAEKLSRVLTKGWTYVNHYFPAMIFDAYNSRLISRFTRDHVESVADLLQLINSKLPFHYCYDCDTGTMYAFKLEPGEISKRLEQHRWPAGLAPAAPEFIRRLTALDSRLCLDKLHAVLKTVFGHRLLFIFDWSQLPGREKCLPILESHLGQAVIVLETLNEQAQHKVDEERARMLDMLMHDSKTVREVLIADMMEGMESDLAAQQLIEQSHKERVMRHYLLRRRGDRQEQKLSLNRKPVDLAGVFTDVFCSTWRGWLKSRRFRASFRRNRHPAFGLDADSRRAEVHGFLQAHRQACPDRPAGACLNILRDSFSNLADAARIEVQAPPLLMSEEALLDTEAILYNLLCNFFNHITPSPLTGCQECVMHVAAEPRENGIYFSYDFRNSADTKELFVEDVRALLRYGYEIHGLQILRYLIHLTEGARTPDFKIRLEDYLWHIYLGRERRDCREELLVNTRA